MSLIPLTSEKADLSYRLIAHIAPGRADWALAKKLDKLQDMVEKLEKSSKINPQLRNSHTEVTLMQCACDVITKGTTMYEAGQTVESIAGGQRAANQNIRVAEWVGTLESINWDQRRSYPSDSVSNVPSVFSGDKAHTGMTSATSAQRSAQDHDAVDAAGDDSDDDLDADLAKAALETGTKAFEAQDWKEADSLLQEALRVLQQLPKQQRAFCDLFSLHYKLAVCAYNTQEPADAEQALTSLMHQSANSDEQRKHIYNAAHLLSLLYIREGQVDRARFECEKALQARRRLLGKRNDASLESTALMAHIYVLLDNRARAKSCLAIIPESCRDAVLQVVEQSLGTKIDRLVSSSPLTEPISEGSNLAARRIHSHTSSFELPSPHPAIISQSPLTNLQLSNQRISSNKAVLEDMRSVTVTSLTSVEGRSLSRATEKERTNEEYFAHSEAIGSPVVGSVKSLKADEAFNSKIPFRKEILDKVGCRPKDGIEDAVCDGDHIAFASLLDKKSFWRSKLRKHVRPERVTALHFAALFGEIEMARRLIESGFNINEIPYGYSTNLTPLKFAIGARQVEMVDFLIANGAKPSEPDSWSTMAGQLMNRSWLMKTMSEANEGNIADHMIAILEILLKCGWDVNTPFEKTGGTLLHQAVTFWTGSYKWDLNLRAAIASFLCERGADPFRANLKGKTPYALALASDHQDLLRIFDGSSKKIDLSDVLAELA